MKERETYMKCPFCEHTESKVIDTRPTEEGVSIRRRRECLKCEKRFTTYEQIETMPLLVVKRDKSRQCFEREKLVSGLLRACVKRPVGTEEIEGIVNRIEQKLSNSLEREISAEKLGDMVLKELADIDEVAYVRFASVYKDFKDIDSFLRELELIRNK